MTNAGTSAVLQLADVVRRMQLQNQASTAGESSPLSVGSSFGLGQIFAPAAQLFQLIAAHQRAAIFACCCLFVAMVSVHDALLIVMNHQVIYEVEQNPIGRWLIEMQGGDVWLFVLAKLAGTAVVCSLLVTLYEARARLATVAAVALAFFQLALLCYLTLA